MAVVMLMAGCGAERESTPTPGIPYPGPRPPCLKASELVPLESMIHDLPDGVSDAEAFVAAVQFLTTAGQTIDTQDPLTHTIVTRPFAGQTIVSSCGVNEYRVYTHRIAISGRRMFVSMDCWYSFGWEANGHLQAHRGAIQRCDPPTATRGDAAMPALVVQGTEGMLTLSKTR